jgi:hypothetical protein
MDFDFTEAQRLVAELARKIFEERCTPASLKLVEATPERFDRPTWRMLASSGLLGTSIPEPHGGSGHGFLELCALLQEAGAAVAPVPLWPTLVLGAFPLARFGTPEQQARFLPHVARGEWLLTAALAEPDGSDPMRVATTARPEGGGWVLDGVKTCVPAADLVDRILVPATARKGGVGMFLVDPRASGVVLERQTTTTGESQHRVAMDGVKVPESDVVGSALQGTSILEWIVARATVALCAMELGMVERALRMTASYASTRNQFDRPIATFQAVSQRLADAYIDVESIRVATWHAAWRLASELPAGDAVSVAKYFAAEAGHRVVFAAQHIHGGMGFDLEYPLHRYYLGSKQIELTLGCASAHLAAIGRETARGP